MVHWQVWIGVQLHFLVWVFSCSMHAARARTCGVESHAPPGETEPLQVAGALRGHKDRSGEDEEQQRRHRQHFRRYLTIYRRPDLRTSLVQMEKILIATPTPVWERTSVSLRKMCQAISVLLLRGSAKKWDVIPMIRLRNQTSWIYSVRPGILPVTVRITGLAVRICGVIQNAQRLCVKVPPNGW